MTLTFLIVFTIVSIICGVVWAQPDPRDWWGMWNWSPIICLAIVDIVLWVAWFCW